jgi:phosphate transport system permease protein
MSREPAPADPFGRQIAGHEEFAPNMAVRKVRAGVWNLVFLVSTLVGVLALVTLVLTLIDNCFGAVILQDAVPVSQVSDTGKPLDQLSDAELRSAFQSAVDQDIVTAGRLSILEQEKPLASRSSEDLRSLMVHEVLQPTVEKAWGLTDTLLNGQAIHEVKDRKYPDGELVFRSWITPDFLGHSQSGDVLVTGIRGAIVGSLWIIFLAVLVSLPVGVGAAIWLEEYAGDTRLNRFVQTNIYNLAGVPSIIYGMLGLALFVRGAEGLTSGAFFGVEGVNGRTVFSAGLTLGLLILPIIIINTQEALKAIPQSLRWSSYGVGATRWQTVWHHVLPAAGDRILTGTVFGVSRALGETAPLVVVGASAFLTLDPAGLFSKFTTLPMQVYTLSQQPQTEFRHLASAAIIVLMVLLLGLNSVAIVLRGRIKKSKEAS